MLASEQIAALQWYIDAGADEACDDAPRNYFAPPAPAPSVTTAEPVHTPPPPPARPQAVAAVLPLHGSVAESIVEARRLADEAQTLDALKAAVCGFEGCAIKNTATHTVFGDGNPEAKLMLIGEAPGAEEDMKGIPFCGASGRLLDKMLAAIGYDRSNYYITNTLFWRPPGNRQPSSEELAACKPFVEKHIALIDPELIVLVGGTAAKSLLGTEQGITRLRGKRYTYTTPYRDKEYNVAVIYHPSYLLRQPAAKRATWQDLLAIRQTLETRH